MAAPAKIAATVALTNLTTNDAELQAASVEVAQRMAALADLRMDFDIPNSLGMG